MADVNSEIFLPLHGGDLEAASQHFAIDKAQWLDLSTGMNPEHYPLDDLPLSAFTQLPYAQAEFIQAVQAYYGEHGFAAVSGSQVAIEALPKLLSQPKVLPILLPAIGYQEHRLQWGKIAPQVFYPSESNAQALAVIHQQLDENPAQHVLVINPNNPTGMIFSVDELLVISGRLATGAFLIVDEAFIDASADASLLNQSLAENTIVLRSFGKFFGLAGVRLGFAFVNPALLQQLSEHLSLWQLNGPAQAVAIKALTDSTWQQSNRQRLQTMNSQCSALFELLLASQHAIRLDTPSLFLSYRLNQKTAIAVYNYFAEQGVLLRLFLLDDGEALLRIGLFTEQQANEKNLQQLVASFPRC